MILFNATGRPELVYGKKCREEELEHEALITEAEILIGAPFLRSVPVGKTVADAKTIREGIDLYLEVDNESMTATQMRDKWERYEGIDGFILLVCRSKGRLRRLIKGAQPVKRIILFSRFKWLRLKHVNKRWVDWKGNRIDLDNWSS